MELQLRDLILEHFSDDDLRSLCFDLGIPYEDLPGESRPAKARELIIYMKNRGRLPELIDRGRVLRSHVTWPDSTPITAQVASVPLSTPLIKASPEEERGLEELAKRLANAGTETQAELATHATSLRENRQAERRFGGSENNRSERARIIFTLNQFALTYCGISFNELCRT